MQECIWSMDAHRFKALKRSFPYILVHFFWENLWLCDPHPPTPQTSCIKED